MKLESEFFTRAIDRGNLGIIAPHKTKYYNCYNIDWLIETVKTGTHLSMLLSGTKGKNIPITISHNGTKGSPFQ